MSDEIKQYLEPGKKNLILVYALYLIGMIVPILPIVGAVFAYANQVSQNNFLKTHYIFAVRTFLFGIIGFIISLFTMIIFIGPFIYLVVLVWFVVRSIIALQYVIQDAPHPNPTTFWIK